MVNAEKAARTRNKGIKRGESVGGGKRKGKSEGMGERIVQREAGCEGKITQTGKVMSKPIERKSVVGPTGNLQQSSLSLRLKCIRPRCVTCAVASMLGMRR